MPIDRTGRSGSAMTNSQLPPPMSTTSVSVRTRRPLVTPRSVSIASSSCSRTWSEMSARDSTSPTSAVASKARRMGSVPTIVISLAPSRLAVAA